MINTAKGWVVDAALPMEYNYTINPWHVNEKGRIKRAIHVTPWHPHNTLSNQHQIISFAITNVHVSNLVKISP